MTNNLWVFGDSLSTSYGLDNDNQSWPKIIADRLGLQLVNKAREACDNFYIYHTILNNLNNIKDTDIVIVGWSHPNRKSFILNKQNPYHTKSLDKSIMFETEYHTFFRSNGPIRVDCDNVSKFNPSSSGIDFFDFWYDNYFDKHEQTTIFQSYIDSVHYRLPNHIAFFFSQSSLDCIKIFESKPMCMIDFVLENNYNLNVSDYHPNIDGHVCWADNLYQKYFI